MADFITSAVSSATVSGVGTGVPFTNAIRTVYSTEIFRVAQPILAYTQVARVKEELQSQPGKTIQFTRISDVAYGDDSLTELVDPDHKAIESTSFSLTVGERGDVLATSEFAIRSSFVDTMAEMTIQLGRLYAKTTNARARNKMLEASNVIRANGRTSRATIVVGDRMGMDLLDDAMLSLVENKVPPFDGEYYVCFVTPRQYNSIRNDPRWEYATAYTQSVNLLNGEVGRIDNIRFIRTTMNTVIDKSGNIYADGIDTTANVIDYSTTVNVHQAILVGEDGLGWGVGLPVELRDGGIRDKLQRNHYLGYYTIDGFGLIESDHIIILETGEE